MSSSGYGSFMGIFGEEMGFSISSGTSGYSGYRGISGRFRKFSGEPGNRLPDEEREIVLRGWPDECFQYACEIVQGRWPEGESVIRKEGYYWRMYLKWSNVAECSWEEKMQWIRNEGFTIELFEILNDSEDMPAEFQEMTCRLRPDLVGLIKDLDPELVVKYRHELEMASVDM